MFIFLLCHLYSNITQMSCSLSIYLHKPSLTNILCETTHKVEKQMGRSWAQKHFLRSETQSFYFVYEGELVCPKAHLPSILASLVKYFSLLCKPCSGSVFIYRPLHLQEIIDVYFSRSSYSAQQFTQCVASI